MPRRLPPVSVAPCPELGGRPCYAVHLPRAIVWVGSADGPAAHIHQRQALQLAATYQQAPRARRPRRRQSA